MPSTIIFFNADNGARAVNALALAGKPNSPGTHVGDTDENSTPTAGEYPPAEADAPAEAGPASPAPPTVGERRRDHLFLKRVTAAVLIAIGLVLACLFIWQTLTILILTFVGILASLVLSLLRDVLVEHTRLPSGPALAAVIICSLIFAGGAVYVMAPSVIEQSQSLIEELPVAVERLQRSLVRFGWGREFVKEMESPEQVLAAGTGAAEGGSRLTEVVMGFFSNAMVVLGGFIYVLILSIYFAAEPRVYTNGVLRLVPMIRRRLAADTMEELAKTLRWWLAGQSVSMLILGVVTTLGLWILGMPFALVLGLFAAVMTFIPNLGPFIAAVPALLIALSVGVEMTIYVAFLYLFIQNLEGYFITPMLHRRVISMPPVLIIAVQLLLLSTVGFLGVAVAMPLVACAMVLIRRLYVEAYLGDDMSVDVLAGDEIIPSEETPCSDTSMVGR